MTPARQFYEQQPELAVVSEKDWPTMYDLPSEDPQEPGLPDEFHCLQPQLLSATLKLKAVSEDQMFTGTDINLYYDLNHPQWYRRPDWFLVIGVPRLYAGEDLRMSYVTWDENVSPTVAVELISPGTAMSDLGEIEREPNGTPTKWKVYEEILRVPYYVVFDRYKEQLWVFNLVDGQYQQQEAWDSRYWMSDVEMGLGVWQGTFKGVNRSWLRWYDAKGQWVPTEAEAERRKREVAEQKAERLAERLRELGVDPDGV